MQVELMVKFGLEGSRLIDEDVIKIERCILIDKFVVEVTEQELARQRI